MLCDVSVVGFTHPPIKIIGRFGIRGRFSIPKTLLYSIIKRYIVIYFFQGSESSCYSPIPGYKLLIIINTFTKKPLLVDT